jgi:putative FmdB family regulatory protein
MPIHEYKCCICNAKVEKRYENSDSAPKDIDCMICGHPAGRIFSSFNIGSKADPDIPEDSIGIVKARCYKISGTIERCPHCYGDMMVVDRIEEQGTVTVPLKDPLKIRMN